MTIETQVTVVGGYGCGNLGDDVLMLAVLDTLRTVCPPSSMRVLVHSDAPYPANWGSDVRFVAWRKVDGHVRTQLLVYGGGTQFYSFANTHVRNSTRPSVFIRRMARAALHPRRVLSWLKSLEMNPLTRVRFQSAAAVGIGVGPFVSWSREETAARLRLSACHYISVRDRQSLNYCRSWGIERAVLRADLSYSSLVRNSICEVPDTMPIAGKDTVAVVFRDWRHTDRGASYFSPLQDAVARLRSAGMRVRFVSFAPTADQESLDALRRRGEEVLCWEANRQSVSAFLKRLGSAQLIISARAHGAILGAIMGIPSICIEIEPKLRFVAQQLGDGSLLWRNPFQAEILEKQVFATLRNISATRKAVMHSARTLRKIADQAEKEFMDFASARLC